MAAKRQLDVVGPSKACRVKRQTIAILIFLGLLADPLLSSAQKANTQADVSAKVRRSYEAKEWEQVAALRNDAAAKPSPETEYLRGVALMRLGRYAEARDAFTAGLLAAPGDARFLVERAGAEYRLQDFASAKLDLRQALVLQPRDEYTLDFLGTIYLLEGNLDAALKYWNRIEKPRLASVRLDPEPKAKGNLSEPTFHAPQVLERDAWQTTDARLENVGVFPQRRLELVPAGEQDYAAVLHLSERDGRDNLRWTGLVSLLSGVPYQTVYPDWYNIGERAINFSSMVRWDAQKRRLFASLSLPVERRADRLVSIFVDGRNENWNLSQTFSGSTSPIVGLNLRRLEAGLELRFVINGAWSWNAGAGVVGRTFRNAGTATTADAQAFFTSGTSEKSWVGVTHTLLRIPERRFTVVGIAQSQFGRGFKSNLGPFGSLGGSLRADWLPHARGDDDTVHFRLRGSELFGTVPLDQLFELGLDRDSPLWLRGHAATVNGEKGRAPLGRRFVLINSEYDKMLYDGGFFRVQAGPLLDMGKITDPTGVIGDSRWLVDAGVQAKIRVLGSVSVVLSYGRDLRNGRGVFFGTTER